MAGGVEDRFLLESKGGGQHGGNTTSAPNCGRYVVLVHACLHILLGAGLMYGFPSLAVSLMHEGVYASKCSEDEPTNCPARQVQINFLFTLGSSFFLVGYVPAGVLMDRYGPRTAISFGSFFVVLGLVFLGVASNHTDFLFPLAFVCLGIGGPGVYITYFHVQNLFPSAKGMVLSLMVGAFVASGMCFILYQVLLPGIVTRRTLCLAHAGVLGFFWLTMALLQPAQSFTLGTRVGCSAGLMRALRKPLINPPKRLPGQRAPAFVSQMMTAPFALATGFFALHLLRFNFRVGTVNDNLLYVVSEDRATELSNVFVVVISLAFVMSPIVGRGLDRFGFPASLLATNLFAIAYSVTILIKTETSQITSFVLLSIHRSLLFATVYAFVAAEFGFANYGKLLGVLSIVSGGVSMLQTVLRQSAAALEDAGDPDPFFVVNVVLLALQVPLLLASPYVSRRERKEAQGPSKTMVEVPLEVSPLGEQPAATSAGSVPDASHPR